MFNKINISFVLSFFVNLLLFISILSAPGDLDLTFNGTGIVATVIGSSNDNAWASALQSDGKIVVAGYSVLEDGDDFLLARFNADGSLDSTFGNNGRVITTNGFATDRAFSIALQSDGKIVIGGSSNSDFALVRYNPNGTLDTSFDSDGKVVTVLSASVDQINSLAIQTDGKIVAAGSSGATSDFALARYNSNGGLDTSFDSDGILITPIGTSSDIANDVAIQPDGKIITCGFTVASDSTFDFALARYNADGTLDTSFDGDGKATTSFGGSSDSAQSLALQSDGKIVVAGYASVPTMDFALARYNTNGSIDTTFATSGKFTTPIRTSDDAVQTVKIQNDGKILAFGFSRITNSLFAAIRLNSNGVLDTSFDTDGKLTTQIGVNTSKDFANSIQIQSDNKILAVGTTNGTNISYDFAIARYNSNGLLDTGFDGDGKVIANVGIGMQKITDIALQSDGKTVAVGYTTTLLGNNFALIRYNPNGSLDTSFDTDGFVSTNFEFENSFATSVAIQIDGKIVVAGYSYNSSASNPIVTLARYNSDGSLDNTFDSDGKVTIQSIGNGLINDLILQSDGKILVAGRGGTTDGYFFTVRFNINGSLDTTLNGGLGYIVTNFDVTNGNDLIKSISLQPDEKIVVGGYSKTNSNGDEFTLVRYNSNGSLDSTFDGDGKVITSISPGEFINDQINSIAIQSDGKIIAAGTTTSNGNSDFAVTRYNTDGSLDTSFDGDGKKITSIGLSYDTANSIVIQSNGKIVVIGATRTADLVNNFAVVQYNSDGSLDTLFGNNGGIRVYSFSDGNNFPNKVITDFQGRLLVAGSINNAPGLVRIQGLSFIQTVTISGRIISNTGRGIPRAMVTLTYPNGEQRIVLSRPFGHFTFDQVLIGDPYIISVRSKEYVFGQNTQSLFITNQSINNIEFFGNLP